jgi:hypothetical protein
VKAREIKKPDRRSRIDNRAEPRRRDDKRKKALAARKPLAEPKPETDILENDSVDVDSWEP